MAADIDDAVLQVVPLGMPWPTIDPFLFCVHHVDAYPRGDGALARAASLAGRNIGNDFAGVDGWRMYHGAKVPGFPQHPHRGFETVTYVRRGLVDHSDSLGATARFGRGDVQWLTAGRGVVHSEMFPLVDTDHDNPLELFQIWLNLPAHNKLADPHFTMLWDARIPKVHHVDDAGRAVDVVVIAGAYGDATPLAPPPDSWASEAGSDLAIWHVRVEAGATWTAPAAHGDDTLRVVYAFAGDGVRIGGPDADVIATPSGAVVRADVPVTYRAAGEGVELLVLQARPIGEPVAQSGPFVMNTEDEIRQAFADYQRTGFGGWPWPADDPVHDADATRFARHADGRVEAAPTS